MYLNSGRLFPILASGCLWVAGEDVGLCTSLATEVLQRRSAPLFGSERLILTERRGKLRIVLQPEAGASRRWSTALVTVVVAAVGSISLLALGGLTALPASAASGAPAVTQCNPPDFPTGAGYQVTCTVSVENYTTSTGATSSTVTTSACLAAAGVVFPSCPLNLGPVDQHHHLDPTRHVGEPVQRHRERCREQCVLQRHGDRQRPGRNAHVGCHGGSVRRIGRRRWHGGMRPRSAAPQTPPSRNATARRTAGAPMPESRPPAAP